MIKNAVVKWTVDLYAPGSVLSSQVVRWIDKWEQFHSRRVIYPVAPMNMLVELYGDQASVLQDFCHIRISPFDDIYNGALDSDLDNILTNTRLDFFLGNELARIAGTALMKAPPYTLARTHSAWMELWEFDEEKGVGKSITEITLQQFIEYVNEKAPR